MKKEKYSMPEILDFINEAFTRNQKETNDLILDLKKDLKQDISDLRQEMKKGFYYHEDWLNRIEKNMVTKSEFNSLLGVLQRKAVISKYEVNHIQTEAII
jgi:hypothetical protein